MRNCKVQRVQMFRIQNDNWRYFVALSTFILARSHSVYGFVECRQFIHVFITSGRFELLVVSVCVGAWAQITWERANESPQNFEWGGRWCKMSPRFCHVSNFQIPDCLHHNAVMQWKAYQPHYPNRVFTISQKHIFNVHQITTSGKKFKIFLARTRTNLPLKMHR